MAAVDIIKNGYVFSNPSFVVRVEKTLNENGDFINRTATNVSVKLTVPAGITAVSFTSDTSGVTCDLNTGVVNVPVVSSDNPVTCYFMFRVDDVTTAINSQWTIPISDQSGNPLFNFVFQPIIIGGLTDQNILDIVGGLVGPPGAAGGAGPANTLTIGTVTQGVANAVISGTAPNQILNLVLPKGDTGVADNLTIGTVTTVAPGDPAAATITGASPNKVLNLSIPQGDTGLGGEMNVQSDWSEANVLSEAYILNKPTIPAAQVSSDWNSVVSPTQILNKPIIPTLLSELTNDAGFITATLTTEQVQDMMNTALVHVNHTNASVIYNDAANRFEITATTAELDGTITDMVRTGDNLVVTGTVGSFSGTLTNIFKDTIFDAQRVGNILEWYVNGVKIKDINLCCTVTKSDVGLSNVPNVDATMRSNHTGVQAQSTVTNLVADLAGKQASLVSGVNIKTINGNPVIGSGDLIVTSTPSLISHTLVSYTTIPMYNQTYAIVPATTDEFDIQFGLPSLRTNDSRYTFNPDEKRFHVTSGVAQLNFMQLNFAIQSDVDADFLLVVTDFATGTTVFAAHRFDVLAGMWTSVTLIDEFTNVGTTPMVVRLTTSGAGNHNVTVTFGKMTLKPAY